MAGRITEETVTKAIINYLNINGWEILCFDFPQSGTGVSLHLNKEFRTTKNKGVIIPDIVAIKNDTVLFFENKDRFVLEDFIKLEILKAQDRYSESVSRLLSEVTYSKIYYGVGMPYTPLNLQKTLLNKKMIDFAVFVNEERITIEYQILSILN